MSSRRRWPLAVALGTLALPGCADILGIGDPIISDGGAVTDAKHDAPTDAKSDAKADASTDADGGGCSSGLACEVCNVSGYTPVTMGKPTVMQGACSSGQMSSFATACVGPNATAVTCLNWQTSNADAGNCVNCVFTMQSSANWGPVVCTPSSCTFNNGGCLDLELSQVTNEKNAGGNGSCGDLLSASYGCQNYACGTCGNSIFSADFQTCDNSAVANECKSYVTALTNASQCAIITAADASPPAKVNNCFPVVYTDMSSLLNVFCGTGP
jgi:hypothetical protein